MDDKFSEDIILTGRFTHAEVVGDLAYRTNQYGGSRQIEAMVKGSCAASIAAHGWDKETAQGIAIGLVLARPNFEQIGEEFLRSKLAGDPKSRLGAALMKVMLNGLSGPRIDAIIKGVRDVLEGAEELSEEAKAAVMAYEVSDIIDNIEDPREMRKAYTFLFSGIYKGTEKNGTVCSEKPEVLEKYRARKPDRKIVQRNPVRRQELENAYEYYLKHFDEISEKYRTALEGEKTEDIVAFYVVSMRENKLTELFRAP